MTQPFYDVVPQVERIDGVEHVVAYEVWADIERRPGYAGDWMGTFDTRSEALAFVEAAEAREP